MEARGSSAPTVIRFGVFEVDLSAWQVRKNGVKLKLTGQPLEILAVLLQRPGELVTREALRARLWPDTVVDFEHSLNAAIKKLRFALGDSPEHPLYIETIPRHGYRFIAPIDGEKQAQVAPTIPMLARTPLAANSRTQRFVLFGLVSALLLAMGAALLLRRPKPAALTYVQLTNFADSASSPALSPDGRMLSFLRGEGTFVVPGQVYVKLLPEGEPVQLTSDNLPKMSPVFSPDGSRIAYTVNDRWTWDTWTVPVMGGAPERWLPNASGLTWIPERRLLFSEIDRGIHMKIGTTNESRADERSVYRPPTEAGMAHRSYPSPDRKWALVVEMDSTGWLPCRIVPFDGSSAGKQVGPSPSKCTSAAWSPDGSRMYFSADAGNGFHIWRQRFPDGTPDQITSGPTEEEGVVIASDGKSLITSVGSEYGTVWLHDGNGERQVSSEGYSQMPSLSADGKKLYYLVRSGASRAFTNGALWVSHLGSGHRESLLPGFLITRYDISDDDSQVIFASDEGDGKSSLWLAPLDRRFQPQRLVASDAYRPLFGPHNEIFFLGNEGTSKFIFRIKQDGTGREKVVADPVMYLLSLSPDGDWIIAWVASDTQGRSQQVVAYPTRGGPPKRICVGCPASGSFGAAAPLVSWSRDQKFLYFASPIVPRSRFGKTFLIPLAPGEPFPDLPNSGISFDRDLLALPGVQILEQTDIFPGPTSSVYAFAKTATQRNLYRIRIP